ncbi:MAG TPA: ribonuclease P protein component [Longimicrobiales bacterium]|nr:ribonuclease P protein component [Longimicrobiales bacterium]
MVRAPGGGGHRLPRARRVTRGNEIRSVLRRGKRSRTVHLDVFDSASPFSYARVGLVVPRHGHSAVARNRLKRRLREIARQRLLPGLDDAGLARDILIRAHARAYDAAYEELLQELERWLEERCSRG